ncbi:hypothetical protein Syun_023994 [Stephania yunnanensis]|uniref:DYW domain-containing protein n=1 Tax=Stephania yunnanensis TaxID=152371 RepID=A0AAP0I049_9MAGN
MKWQHYRSLIRQCARHSQQQQEALKLHAALTKNGLAASPRTFILNALLQLHASLGHTSSAHKLFDEIPHSHKDAIDWTTLIASYSRHSQPRHALSLFAAMPRAAADEVTFIAFFAACSQLGDWVAARQGHGHMIKAGLPFTVSASNAAMDVYAKCGLMGDAWRVFGEMGRRSVVSWTVILSGEVRWEGVRHGRKVFDEMPERNAVAWTVMIVGYVESGLTNEGFSLITELVLGELVELNYVTLCSVLSACSQSGDLSIGRWIHAYGLKTMKGDQLHIMVGTALLDMYSKCGQIDKAFRVFESMANKNVVAWNAMLSGLAMHGRGLLVLDLFPQLMAEVKPDDVTFVAVLSACSHSGLVDQGRHYFHNLRCLFGVTPKIEHYSCMVDLLGRAGLLDEAHNLVKQMPIPPNEVVIGSVLAACALHGKFQLGEHMLQELAQLDPLNTEYHMLLSNMYSLAGKVDEARSFRRVLKSRGIRKLPGMSSIRVNGQVHRFTSGDKSHFRTQDVYIKLDEIIRRLRSAGYVPNVASQIFSVSEGGIDDAKEVEEKEQMLFSHSEKLAIAFGLISTGPGAPLHIFKNLRICLDCHSAVKLISDIYQREIVIRDRNRFHCFRHGSCSCSDYW